MISVMDKMEEIIFYERINENDINFLKNKTNFYKPLLLKIHDLEEHGEDLIKNILNATLQDTYYKSIQFFNNDDCFNWNDRLQRYKTDIIKLGNHTNFLLNYINRLYDSLFQLHCDFSNNPRNDIDSYFDDENDFDFDFRFIYNKVLEEPILLAKKKILLESIADRDLLCLSLGLDPEKYQPNIQFKEKCIKAIETIKLQIENTIEDKTTQKPETKTTLLEEQSSSSEPETLKNPEFTTRRQVLTLFYLLEAIDKGTNSIDRTVKARFIHFLTGKNESNIYKTLTEPHKGFENEKNKRSAIKDLEFIKKHFDELGLKSISQKITNDMTES